MKDESVSQCNVEHTNVGRNHFSCAVRSARCPFVELCVFVCLVSVHGFEWVVD